ncbi:hypothetical protein D3C84_1258710 [compost metagenome]
MITMIYSVLNFDIVAGGEKGENLIWIVSLVAVFGLGVCFAIYLKVKKNQIYQNIGQSETIFNN